METKVIPTNYTPRDWQLWAHGRTKRHNVIVFHRRGGKTVWAVNEIKDKAINFDKADPKTGEPLKNPKFAFIAPSAEQVRDIAWDYVKEYFGNLPGVKFNETRMKCTFPHPRGTCTVTLYSAENIERRRGLYLDGYVLDEYADMHPDTRDKVLLPTLSDRAGWEIIIGTPKGDNAFKKIYDVAVSDPEDWFSCIFKATQTDILPEKELKLLKKTMTEEAFRQEYLCDFHASPAGYYYQKIMDQLQEDGHITNVPYDKQCSVMTFWDLGFNDSGVIWFIQEVGREIHVIDYVENNGKGLDWYVDCINEKPYQYVAHYLPHDVEHHEISSGQSRLEYLENLNLNNIQVVPKSGNINEDIHAVRQVLYKCYFDKNKCKDGIEALRQYRRKYDSKEQVFKNNPVHNWASHGADGFRQFAVVYEPGMSKYGSIEHINSLPEEAEHDFDIMEDF